MVPGRGFVVCAGVALAFLLARPRAADVVVRLVDVAEQAGVTVLNVSGDAPKDYIVDSIGSGAAWFDYDNDGDLDLLIVNGSTRDNMKLGGDPLVVLYQNDGQGHFKDVTAASRLTRRGWGMGTCVADYDNDGFDDVYVTAWGPNVLFHNNGNGTFSDVTRMAGVGDAKWGTGCAFGDYDRDGRVDLYVANYVAFDERKILKRGEGCSYMTLSVYCGPMNLPGEADVLYHNNGNGTFADVTKTAGVNDPGYYGFGVVFADLDDDGWPDIYVGNDSVPNLLFHNNRDGTFTEEGLKAGVAFGGNGRAQAGMGVDAADYDNDGHLDLVVTNFSHDYNTLYENSGSGFFTDVSHVTGIARGGSPFMGWGVGFVDMDNDGLLDLFVANGHVYPDIDRQNLGTTYLQTKQLFRNLGSKRFRNVTAEVGGGLLLKRSSRGAAFGDYDNDGDIDVIVLNLNDRPTLLRNDTPPGNHWVTIRLVGTKSNRDGIGARIRIDAGGRRQTAEVRGDGSYLSHNDLRAHFGLGDVSRVDSVEIRWPSDQVERFSNVPIDRVSRIVEGRGRIDEGR
jgi:enediyne biosynthesis protein E4